MKWTWKPLTTCIVHVQWTKDNFYNSFSWFLFTHVQILTSLICISIPRNSQTESLYEGISRVPVCPSRVMSSVSIIQCTHSYPSIPEWRGQCNETKYFLVRGKIMMTWLRLKTRPSNLKSTLPSSRTGRRNIARYLCTTVILWYTV